MKRWALFTVLVSAVITLSSAYYANFLLRERSELDKQREAGHQVTLRAFQSSFSPGMTRKEVEDRLRAQNVDFSHLYCTTPCSDLVKVGAEQPPFYCSENYVFVAFNFSASEGNRDTRLRTDDRDALQSITILHQLDGCL